jgi:predicted kinase
MSRPAGAEECSHNHPEPGLVVLMCGLPGSGKSTYARMLEKQGFTRLSIDEAIWRRIGHDAAELPPESYEHLKTETEAELWDELVDHLQARRPVVVDYSFWNRERRERYKTLIERHGCRWELVHLKASVETLLRRLRLRNNLTGANSVTVSEELLRRHAANFEEPWARVSTLSRRTDQT